MPKASLLFMRETSEASSYKLQALSSGKDISCFSKRLWTMDYGLWSFSLMRDR